MTKFLCKSIQQPVTGAFCQFALYSFFTHRHGHVEEVSLEQQLHSDDWEVRVILAARRLFICLEAAGLPARHSSRLKTSSPACQYLLHPHLCKSSECAHCGELENGQGEAACCAPSSPSNILSIIPDQPLAASTTSTLAPSTAACFARETSSRILLQANCTTPSL